MPLTLIERIQNDIKDSLRGNKALRVSVMRLLLAAVKNKEIALKRPLENAEVIDTVAAQIKLRRESVEGFLSGGRSEMAEKEQQEILILQEYMPPQLSDRDVRAIIDKAIADTQATSIKDIGKIMAAIMPHIKGRADGAAVNRIVKEKLSL
jgi:hypothetical protein